MGFELQISTFGHNSELKRVFLYILTRKCAIGQVLLETEQSWPNLSSRIPPCDPLLTDVWIK